MTLKSLQKDIEFNIKEIKRVLSEYELSPTDREELNKRLRTLRDDLVIVTRLQLPGSAKQQTPLDVVGKTLGLTKERIRQIQNQALRKLSTPNVARKLREYLDLYDSKDLNTGESHA